MHCIIVVMANALKTLKRCLLCLWDRDFSKVTKEEKYHMDIADEEMKKGVYFSEEDVWGN